MSDQFKALILDQEGENFSREVKSIDKSFLKHGDVTVKVDYSDLNFKDGMILKNGGRLVKDFLTSLELIFQELLLIVKIQSLSQVIK